MQYATCASCNNPDQLSQMDLFVTTSSEKEHRIGSITICNACKARMPVVLQSIVDASTKLDNMPVAGMVECLKQIMASSSIEMSYDDLARALTAYGVPTPYGKPWTGANLRAYLDKKGVNKTSLYRSLGPTITAPTPTVEFVPITTMPTDMPGLSVSATEAQLESSND